mmetsp:Transcript_37834/g.92979  ORF Transcript_37834/g.92979 Transcript_37834/m.92979 type:complete len:264 (+) Transcript_37834:509-1300(+)
MAQERQPMVLDREAAAGQDRQRDQELLEQLGGQEDARQNPRPRFHERQACRHGALQERQEVDPRQARGHETGAGPEGEAGGHPHAPLERRHPGHLHRHAPDIQGDVAPLRTLALAHGLLGLLPVDGLRAPDAPEAAHGGGQGGREEAEKVARRQEGLPAPIPLLGPQEPLPRGRRHQGAAGRLRPARRPAHGGRGVARLRALVPGPRVRIPPPAAGGARGDTQRRRHAAGPEHAPADPRAAQAPRASRLPARGQALQVRRHVL